MSRSTTAWLNGLDLNEQQRAAVTYTDGPMRVLAGAGTGKTHTLTSRFAYLVREHAIPAHQILALTFSRKAADEMRSRVLSHLEGGHQELSISTFHSFCLRLITQWRREIGLAAHRVIDDDQRRWYVTQVVHALPTHSLTFYPGSSSEFRLVQDVLTLSDRAKELLRGPDDIARFAMSIEDGAGRLHDLTIVFRAYQDRLKQEGVCDYGDLALDVVGRLRSDPKLLAQTRSQFQHMLVDEFQDTNLAQFELVKLLCPEGDHLCVVGDPNQSIYAFRGGKPEYMTKFETFYPLAKTFRLDQNYRSGSAILTAANQLIACNKDSDYLELKSVQLSFEASIQATEAATVDHEAELIARRIHLLISDPGNELRYGDIAILVRSLKTSQDPIVQALTANGIPYRLGRKASARYDIVQDLFAALRLAIGPPQWRDAARMAARNGASSPLLRTIERRLGERERAAALSGERIDHVPLYPSERATLTSVQRIVERAATLRTQPMPALVYGAMLLSGHLSDKTSPEIGEFLSDVLRQAESLNETGATAQDLLDQLLAEHGEGEDESPSGTGGVHLLTVHAAKGLEWKIVFVAGLANSLFPVPMRLDRDFDLAELTDDGATGKSEEARAEAFIKEERRLAYVALTRGKSQVHLLIPRQMNSRPLVPSIFVAEAGLGEPVKETLLPEGPPATIAELSRRLRTRRQRALAEPIDVENADSLLGALLLAHWAANDIVDGAAPIRDRLIPAPFGDGTPLRFSYSQLSTYETCPRQYLYGAVLKLQRDEEYVSAAFGSAIHAALNLLNQQWRENRKPPEDHEVERAVTDNWPEAGFDFSAQREQLRQRAVGMLARYYRFEHTRQPGRVPMAIEEPFTAAYGSHSFTGRIDLAVTDRLGEDEIIDFKTGRKANLEAAPESLQLYLYDHAWRSRREGSHPKVSFYALRQEADKGFQLGGDWEESQVSGVQHTDETALSIRARIDGLLAGILANDFTPRPSDAACNYCRFRWLCPEG